MNDRARRWPAWAGPVFLSAGILAVAIGLGLYADPGVGAGPTGGPMFPRTPPPPPDLQSLLFQLGVGSVVWYAAAIALPLLLVASRRVDVERLGAARTMGLVFSVALVLVAASSLVDYTWMFRGAPSRPSLRAFAPLALRRHVLPIVAVLGIAAAVEARRRALHGVIDRERLHAEVARQRLLALAGQLRPHFLFNTLQAISTLIHRDPEAADEMLSKLSDLLRDVLRHRDSPFVRLEDEMRYARTWLEIAKVRFGDRLAFEIDVPAGLDDLSVPLFVLQPLLENALTHGIGGRMAGGHVTIRARQSDGRLRLDVIDDGAGLPASSGLREGIGLANTRERLQAAFGADHQFRCGPAPGGGTAVAIDMPARAWAEAPA